MNHPTNHIFEHTPETLAAWCTRVGMPSFRAQQILEWVYMKGVADPAKMTNLSARDRETLAREMTFVSGDIVRRQAASDGTLKLLVQWRERDEVTERRRDAVEEDGGLAAREAPSSTTQIAVALPQFGGSPDGLTPDPTRQTECVMIPADDRRTACISSQVGCPVGCKFCASGLGGLDANLSAGRIVEQVWLLRKAMQEAEANPEFTRITNVVFMGMGEPLANLGAVVPAVRTICSLWGHAISARKVTISTVGLPKAIEKLAEQLDMPVTLALSLHAPNDELRRELIPWAEFTTIKDLLAALQRWFEKTGREVTLEYTLLRGVNDRPEHAKQLADLSKTLRANINLIRYNEVAGMPFERPHDEDVRGFQEYLRSRNVNVHIRASRGRDIAAACGQLRHETGDKARKRSGAAQ
ncbi:MAG TPA: 23S rRNA (adenine(2503)-C(2))-methyltransferase RlmN [Phycisphaerales bacterium]|nr:23S rRNA (adenine(2503)-C(2))-methyltransferase RlmN [Phycisphaerales bacterium]